MRLKLRHPRIIGILIAIAFTLLLIDACLYHADPLGIVDGTYSNHTFHFLMQDDATGYRLPSGVHHFHSQTIAILDDGSRVVPATNADARCTIAAIGDSMTFGSGVGDSETWVNLLAEIYQDVHFINPARPDYSAPNVAALKTAYPADGYLWLLIFNDILEPYVYQPIYPAHPYPAATAIYKDWLVRRFSASQYRLREVDMGDYWQAVEQIAGDNVLIFGFINDALTMNTAFRYPVVLIPPYTAFVSRTDIHPNPIGHQQIASSLLPYLSPFLEQVCDAET